MKRFVSLLMVALVMLGLGWAQKSTRPWYGSKIGVDAILKSDFCNKYKCILEESLDFRQDKKTQLNWLLTYKTIYDAEAGFRVSNAVNRGDRLMRLDVGLDKSNRVKTVSVRFQSSFGPPPNTVLDEISAQYLTDLVVVALGKKYRYVPRDGDANPTDDMNTKCMTGIDLSKKVYRILEQGKIAFEGETKARPYVAYCMVRPSRDNPNEWPKINQPMFAIYDSVYIPK